MTTVLDRTLPRGREGALTALTLGIAVLAIAAFAYTQARKQEGSPIAGIRFDSQVVPGCDCPREEAALSLVLERAQPIDATVVDESEEPVRTLVDGEPRESGRLTLRWDGTDDAGRPLPEGDYRLRVDLAAPDRTIVIPADVRLIRSG